MADMKIGKVIHYYDKLGVAIVELSANLAAGETIRFERGGEEMFEQKVDSMQIEHEQISEAKKGETIGLKVEQEVKEEAEVYKVE